MQFSKLTENKNLLQCSNCMPNSLQFLNWILLRVVFVNLAMLKLQLVNEQSIKLMSDRLVCAKVQFIKVQFS